jgi:NAD(P)-dependent dehydrogenase (short-subunit alcohol dehydrogenase family)
MTQQITALITGGAGHIGAAIAHKLAENNINVIILDKFADPANALVETLSKTHGGTHHAIIADLLDKNCFASIANQVKTCSGTLDYLVNNAAFYDETPGWGVPFAQEGYDAWMKVMQVNLLAPFFLTQALHPLMEATPNPAVVNIGSIYGVVGPDFNLYTDTKMSNPAAYGASKGGLLQLTRWMSAALAPKLRTNMVSPGGIARGQDASFVEKYETHTPLNRMGRETDIAGAVHFLLSPEAAYITGQNLLVDGGWTAI